MPTPNYICGRKRIRAMFETDLSVPFVVQIFDVRPRQVDGLCQENQEAHLFHCWSGAAVFPPSLEWCNVRRCCFSSSGAAFYIIPLVVLHPPHIPFCRCTRGHTHVFVCNDC